MRYDLSMKQERETVREFVKRRNSEEKEHGFLTNRRIESVYAAIGLVIFTVGYIMSVILDSI